MQILVECILVLACVGLGLVALAGLSWLVSPALAPVGRRAEEINMEEELRRWEECEREDEV